MAKRSARVNTGLICEVCKNQNYVTEKNKINTPDTLFFNKYCDICVKVTKHKESKKLD